MFLAEDLVLSRQVAVKRLHTEAAESGAERFRREAQLGASLNHPNIVAVYDTISGPDGVLLVMEYVPGRPLSSLLASGSPQPEEAIRILRQVSAGLDYAHARGVVHRDVKPANILVRDDGGVKLSDLGVAIAAHLSRITATHDVLGTLNYIAPERLDGEAGGPAADVYSLAAVAFEVLSGRWPDRGASPAEFLRRSATEPPPDLREAWPAAPAAAAAVLRRGLDPDPERRPLSAGRLIDELDEGLARTGTAAATPQHVKPVTITGLVQEPATGNADRRGAGGDGGGHRAASDQRRRLADRLRPGGQRRQEREGVEPGRGPVRPGELHHRLDHDHDDHPGAPRVDRGRLRGAAQRRGLRPDPARALRRGGPAPAARRRGLPQGDQRSRLRVRAVQPRPRAASRRPTPRGDPDPGATPADPQSGGGRQPGARLRPGPTPAGARRARRRRRARRQSEASGSPARYCAR